MKWRVEYVSLQFQVFKGLETPIGIITNLCEYNLALSNPIMSSLLYVAATRAKHMLYFLMKEGDPKLRRL